MPSLSPLSIFRRHPELSAKRAVEGPLHSLSLLLLLVLSLSPLPLPL
jgi:hypothetical protein